MKKVKEYNVIQRHQNIDIGQLPTVLSHYPPWSEPKADSSLQLQYNLCVVFSSFDFPIVLSPTGPDQEKQQEKKSKAEQKPNVEDS